MNRVIHGLQDIAEGDGNLTLRLPVHSKDEIGTLSGWFNIFLEKIQNIIRELAGKSAEVDNSSANLLTIAEVLSDNAGNTFLLIPEGASEHNNQHQNSCNINQIRRKRKR